MFRPSDAETNTQTQPPAARGEVQARDDFLEAVYHHLSEPLAAMVGLTDMLQGGRHDFSAAVRNQIIELLAIQAQETSRVVDDLLIAASFDQGEIEIESHDVDLRTVVEAATEDWASRQRSRLFISGNAVARADERWLTVAVGNLLRNAAAYGERNIWVKITEGHSRVVIDVIDDGDGIDPEEQEKIFDPYFSSPGRDRDHPSLGLGLFVARRLARSMGGDVQYQREADRTLFELSVPRFSLRSGDREPAMEVIIDPLEGKPSKESLLRLLQMGGPEMVYQPIVDMRVTDGGDQRILGYEGLARFPFSGPPLWFEAAEPLGMRLDLELAAIRAAISGYDPAQAAGFLALNLSDVTLTSSRLAEALEGVDPGRVILELSEEAVVRSYETTERHVRSLRERGIRLAVDDVGSGEIDMWHLLRLEPEVIKVDTCLVRDVHSTPRNRALIRGISAMARDLGIMVIAEGIESPQEAEQLVDLGVDYGQGYLFAKPRPLLWKSRILSDD